MKRGWYEGLALSGLAVAAMLPAIPASAQDQPGSAPEAAPAAAPEPAMTKEELLRRIEDLRRQMEEMERTGRARFSQMSTKTPEELTALGEETKQAMVEGQNALLAARYAVAEERLKKALTLAQDLFGENEIWAGILHNLGVTYHNQGRIAEAEQAYGRILEWRDEVPGRDHSDMGVTFMNLGSLYYDQKRYDEAETVIERALTEQREKLGPDAEATLVSLGGLGTIYRAQGRYEEAEKLLTDAIARMIKTLGADHEHTLSAQNSLGVLYRSTGRVAEAERLLRRALDVRRRKFGSDHPDTLNSLDSLGNLYREQKRFGDAEPISERAFGGYRKRFGDEHPLTLVSAADLALTRLELNKAPQALEAARLAVAGARARRGGAGADRYTEAQRAREEAGERRHYLLLADSAWGAGAGAGGPGEALKAEAFLALQDSLGGAANQAITQMAVRRYAEQAGEGLGALLRERITLNERWLGNMQQFARAQADASGVAPQMRAQLREERDVLSARLAELDQRLAKEFPDYFALIRPQALDLAGVRRLLTPDEAILLAVPTAFGTHAMAVTREGAAWMRADWDEAKVGAAAERLRWDAAGAAQGDPERVQAWLAEQRDGVMKFDRAAAHALYQQLVAPVAAHLSGKKRLYVAAGGALASLPFSLLVTRPPMGDDADPQALRDTAWLADAYALVHIPSVQSLQLLRKAAGRNAGDRGEGGFVGFGDPALAGPAAARRGGVALPSAQAVIEPSRAPWGGTMASVKALRAMPQLPGTARELAAMQTIFGAGQAQVFTRAEATESAVRGADLSKARVIAFATHGLTPGELVGGTRTASELYELAEPGLVLTPPEEASAQDDGYLAASEVTALKLDADWVILSACNSATPDDASEPGLSSLARAFFYAGARNLLASHWPVDDEVGARITVRTIALERAGTPRAEAFQQAMREIRMEKAHDASGGSWAHPFFWAPFVLIGDGGS